MNRPYDILGKGVTLPNLLLLHYYLLLKIRVWATPTLNYSLLTINYSLINVGATIGRPYKTNWFPCRGGYHPPVGIVLKFSVYFSLLFKGGGRPQVWRRIDFVLIIYSPILRRTASSFAKGAQNFNILRNFGRMISASTKRCELYSDDQWSPLRMNTVLFCLPLSGEVDFAEQKTEG